MAGLALAIKIAIRRMSGGMGKNDASKKAIRKSATAICGERAQRNVHARRRSVIFEIKIFIVLPIAIRDG